VVEIEPEAYEIQKREAEGMEVILRSRQGREKKGTRHANKQRARQWKYQWAHEKNKDGIAKSTEQQILRA